MLHTILKIFEYRKIAQEGKEDPKKFVDTSIVNTLYALSFFPFLISITVLGLLFLFGFTHVITIPSTLAKIFFFIILFAVIIFISILRMLTKIAKGFTAKVDTTIRQSIDSDFTEEEPKMYDAEFTVKK